MSIRNNEDRTGERLETAASAPPPMPGAGSEASPSMTLDFTCPTEFVDLPSRGRFYPEGHPLYGRESVEIRFMTAKDEDILTSKSLLKKGVAIDRFLQNIIVDKSIKLSDMFIGDKNALVVAARVTGYGANYATKTTCPACGNTQEYQFNLEEKKIKEGGLDTVKLHTPALVEDIEETSDNTWVVECPRSKVKVELRLLTGAHEKFLLKSQAMKKKQKLPEAGLTDQLRQTIVSVNGDTKPGNINRFIDVMPAMDSRFLRGIYENLMPKVDLTQHFECQSCDFEQDMEVPFTTDFFWPKR